VMGGYPPQPPAHGPFGAAQDALRPRYRCYFGPAVGMTDCFAFAIADGSRRGTIGMPVCPRARMPELRGGLQRARGVLAPDFDAVAA
jgi:hypothetical protein